MTDERLKGPSRLDLLNLIPPKGHWGIAILKATGQPYFVYFNEITDDRTDGSCVTYYRAYIPELNCEITSNTEPWEILV